ncbi:response regulator transcription factor [Amycolatopsis xylanica]|uniref:response regulator transcription factor n=1 Tax=Amycolatopsis xylanica TaxID=589385 RepID=UPI0015A47F57|nr:response regulator transcription factor [Amycolatopsis xylanica]
MDDQPLVRYALRTLLESRSGIQSIIEAGSEQEALRTCAKSLPDVVITELFFATGPVGARICQFVKGKSDDVKVMVYTSASAPSAVAVAMNAGADSFVHKSVGCAELMDAVERTKSGQRTWILRAASRPFRVRPDSTAALTPREEEILELVLHRWSNAEIAQELKLAKQTVKNYVSRVLQKLGFASRRDLLRTLGSR